jgi:DNA-binding NarL/FixJ family response regulator
MINPAWALIVAKPGELRESLQALLMTIPHINVVYQTDNSQTVLAPAIKQHPALVLLDFDLPNGELLATLEQMRIQWPQTRCAVLVDNEQEKQIVNAARADVVLMKGTQAAKLLATVEDLLP